MAIRVEPATPDRWDDVMTILGDWGERGCWCQAPRGLDAGHDRSDPTLRTRILRAQMAEDPPPGLLAYLDDEVVGWIGFWPREWLPRLQRSRTIPVVDDLPVWSILCFNV